MVLAEGVIDRKQNAIHAKRRERSQEWRQRKEPAGGNPDLIENGLTHCPLQIAGGGLREDIVHACHHGRQSFAHVPDNDFQSWILLQCSGQHHTQDVNGRFRVPSPAWAGEKKAGWARQAGKITVAHRFRRNIRMQINRDIQSFSARQNGTKKWIIQKTIVSETIDERSAKSKFADTTLKFVRGRLRRGHWKMGKTCKSSGIFSNSLLKPVIVRAGELRPFLRRQKVSARAAHGQHLHCYTGFIHACNAVCSHFFQFLNVHHLRWALIWTWPSTGCNTPGINLLNQFG